VLALIVAVPTVTAFVESYNGLFQWAVGHLVRGMWARAWPLQVDAFIAAGELALFLSALYLWPRRVRLIAWTVSMTGLVVSIWCNAGHVGKDASGWDHLTAAVPPVAAMGGLVVALAVTKRVTHMGVGAPSLPGGVSPFTSWRPHSAPAAAATLCALTYDLIASVADATVAVDTLVGQGRRPVPAMFVTPSSGVISGSRTPVVPESGPDLRVLGQRAADAVTLDQIQLDGMATDADRVRMAIDQLGHDSTPRRIAEWLSVRGQNVAIENVRTTLRRVRATA
jgi:hypothetical protein